MNLSIRYTKKHPEMGRLTVSPTIPIQYPAAKPDSPTDRPAARCKNPLRNGLSESHVLVGRW